MPNPNKVINSFLLLCDNSLSKEASKIRTMLMSCESGEFTVRTIKQIGQVEADNCETFEAKLKYLLTTWSDVVIVLTSNKFATFIDTGKGTENLPKEIPQENAVEARQCIQDFFNSDSENTRSKIIAISSIKDDQTLPQSLSHVQPVVKDNANKNAFVNKLRGLVTSIANSRRS